MNHFKRDFLKVLMLNIVYFSFTRAPKYHSTPNKSSSLEECEDGMQFVFGLNESALSCIKRAILNLIEMVEYNSDANDYYLTFHELVKADLILPQDEFCRGLPNDPEWFHIFNGAFNYDYSECEKNLRPFGIAVPTDNHPSTSFALSQHTLPLEFGIKETIVYNALYNQKISLKRKRIPNNHNQKSYGFFYLHHISKNIQLINNNTISPKQFCEDKYTPKN